MKLSSAVAVSHACVRVSSNVWPGAHAFAVGNKFENVYIGTGIKQSKNPYRYLNKGEKLVILNEDMNSTEGYVSLAIGDVALDVIIIFA